MGTVKIEAVSKALPKYTRTTELPAPLFFIAPSPSFLPSHPFQYSDNEAGCRLASSSSADRPWPSPIQVDAAASSPFLLTDRVEYSLPPFCLFLSLLIGPRSYFSHTMHQALKQKRFRQKKQQQRRRQKERVKNVKRRRRKGLLLPFLRIESRRVRKEKGKRP